MIIMNIAFLTTEYVTEDEFDGGLANYLHRMVTALMSEGHIIEIFTLSNENSLIYHQGLAVHRVQGKSPFFEFFNRLTRYRFKRTFRFLSLSYSLRKRLLRRHLDKNFVIVQASSCFACALFSTFRTPIPIVVRVSSFEPLFRKFYKRPLNLDQYICEWLELLAIKRSDASYTPSRFLSNLLTREKSVASDVIRPPFLLDNTRVDDSIYKKHLHGKRYLLFFGTIGFLKGCEIIADSLPPLLRKYPELHFVFVGKVFDGPNHMDMMEYILEKAGQNRNQIIHLGVLRHPELYPIIKHAHAVVLPSLIDNLPNTMLEAMALGKVVIGTQGTSFEEFIDNGISGILVEPGNSKTLSEAMENTWLLEEEERKAIGHEAQRRISLLSPEITCSELVSFFRKHIKKTEGESTAS